MANDHQLVRAVALVHALVTSKRGVALKQFADKRGWNLRALYRDIKALERAGFPVEHEHGWWSLPDDWLPAGSVGVTHDELIALYVARNLTPGLTGTPVGRDLTSLWQKLSRRGAQTWLVPPDEIAFGGRSFSAIDYTRHQPTIAALTDAIGRRRVAWIHYRDGKGRETTREIEPGYIHYEGAAEALYVPSWCRLRAAPRMFAVHRILAIDVRDERTAARAVMARPRLERAFRLWYRDQLEKVVLRFSVDVAVEIRERLWHPSQRLVDDREGGVYLHLEIASAEELDRWLLGFGASVRVIESVSLAERVHAAHVRAAKVGAPAAIVTPLTGPRQRARRSGHRAAAR